jgi:hypothetical protein
MFLLLFLVRFRLPIITELLQELTVRRFTPPDAFRPFPNFFQAW